MSDITINQPGANAFVFNDQISPETENALRTLLSSPGDAAGKTIQLQGILSNLTPAELSQLETRLEDPKDELSQLGASAFNKPLLEVLPQFFSTPSENFTHMQAALGDPLSMQQDAGTEMSIDQWNYYRNQALPDGQQISAAQTEAMIQAAGGDRSKTMSAADYLALFNATSSTDATAAATQTATAATHPAAASGDPNAIGQEGGTEMTIDQWNYYRNMGPANLQVGAGQTDAMIQAAGGDRSKPIPVQDYLQLLNNTSQGSSTSMTPDQWNALQNLLGSSDPSALQNSLVHGDPAVIIDPPVTGTPDGGSDSSQVTIVSDPTQTDPAAASPATTLARAAQGDLNSADLDGGQTMTIDDWNAIRTNGNPPDVPPLPPISSTQTDAMIAAAGGDRSTPMSVQDYLNLLAQTGDPAAPVPDPVAIADPGLPVDDPAALEQFIRNQLARQIT